MQDRILTVLAERPVLAAEEIRAALPDIKNSSVTHAIDRLRAAGRIESAAWGHYRLTRKIEAPTSYSENGYIRPPLAKLMAGR